MCVVQGPAEGPDLLLLGVAGLQQLRSLNLIGSDEFFWPAAGPAYNALTASSGLVSLVLMGRFPEGILPHVFPAQCRLPHLTYLRFGNGLDFQGAVPQPVWNAADLSRLVSCCPNLRSFIDVSLQHGSHVSMLTKLQDLRTLHVQYGDDGAVDGAGQDIGGATFAESVRGLATLTQLRRLHYYDSEVLVEENFLPLTSLTTLTALQIIDCNLAEHAFCKRQVSQLADTAELRMTLAYPLHLGPAMTMWSVVQHWWAAAKHGQQAWAQYERPVHASIVSLLQAAVLEVCG
jgi:hypothetical protein